MEDRADKFIDFFLLLIAVVIIGLKCVGVITISWFWLFFPLIFLFGSGIIIALIFAISVIIYINFNKGEHDNEWY